jgi:NAD(P) transhydrogenase
MDEQFDMVVIGAGPAGEKGAAQAAYFGKRVAIVERAAVPGGSAVSFAGVPTKTLRETALYITGFRKRDVYGLSLEVEPDITLERLTARTSEVVATMTRAVQRNLDRHGIELVHGTGRLGARRTVVASQSEGGPERVLRGEVILIATGSRPLHPPGIPFEHPDVYDSEQVLQLEHIPKTMVVVGGGPVGCEYASIFTALGMDVTLLDAGPRLVPFMDAEMSSLLAESFRDMGMRVVQNSGVATITRAEDGIEIRLASGDVLRPEQVLFSGGRVGNTEDLGLAEAGVEVDERGRILVDDTYRTTAEGIYAAGDVIGPPALASVSQEQGRVATCNAFHIPFKDTVDPLPPLGVYSIPELAMVGMTEDAAAAAGIDYEVGRAWLADNVRSIIAGSPQGLIKLVFRRDDRRLLGVHILGEEAAELIHQGQALIYQHGTIDHFIHVTLNLPTRSEAYKYAAYDGLQRLSGRILR